MEYVVSELYDEKIEELDAIKEDYLIVQSTSKSKYFYNAYKINQNYAVTITEHIELFHLEERIEIEGEYIFPWDYASGMMYIGDSWWSDDEEILTDLQHLSILDFYEKYKGF